MQNLKTGLARTFSENYMVRCFAEVAGSKCGPKGHTTMTALRAADRAGGGDDVAMAFLELVRNLHIASDEEDTVVSPSVDEEIILTRSGMELRQLYLQARNETSRKLLHDEAARRILLWQDATSTKAVLADILETPFGHRFGVQFDIGTLGLAFQILLDKGYLKAIGSWQDPTLGLHLTPKGRECVISTDGDVSEFEHLRNGSPVMSSANHFNISGPVGNFVAGNNSGSMHSIHQTNVYRQSALDLAQLLQTAVETGGTRRRNPHIHRQPSMTNLNVSHRALSPTRHRRIRAVCASLPRVHMPVHDRTSKPRRRRPPPSTTRSAVSPDRYRGPPLAPGFQDPAFVTSTILTSVQQRLVCSLTSALLDTCWRVFSHELVRGRSAPRRFPGGAGTFNCNNHQAML